MESLAQSRNIDNYLNQNFRLTYLIVENLSRVTRFSSAREENQCALIVFLISNSYQKNRVES